MTLVDPFIPQQPHRPAPPRQQQAARVQSRTPTKEPPQSRWAVLELPLIFCLAAVLGFAAESQTLGELAIAAYGLVALIRRIRSQVSFGLALAAFAVVLGLLLFHPQNQLIANFSVYAFLLLAVGTVSLALENRRKARPHELRNAQAKQRIKQMKRAAK